MKIVESLIKLQLNFSEQANSKASIKDLNEFYQDMLKKGLIIKQAYVGSGDRRRPRYPSVDYSENRQINGALKSCKGDN